MRDCIPEQERAIKEDPLNFVLRFTLASSLIADGNYAEGDEQLRQAMELADGNFIQPHMLSVSLAAQDKMGEALSLAERAYALAPWSAWTIGGLAGIAARTGDQARSQALRTELENTGGHAGALGLAFAHNIGGDTGEAAKWTTQAIDERVSSLIPMLLSHPISGPLRRSSHWPAIARKLNLHQLNQ